MRRIPLNGLGLSVLGMSVADRSRSIPVPGVIFGVGIASDSEIDQCAVGVRGNGGDAGDFVGDLRASDVMDTTADINVILQTTRTDFVKIAVGSPWIGRLAVDELVIAATRAVSSYGSSSLPRPSLIVDLAESPEEAIALAARTRRAPLDIPFSGGLGNGGDIDLIFPTYGRKWWSLSLIMQNVTGTPVKTYSVYGMTEILYQVSADPSPPGLYVDTSNANNAPLYTGNATANIIVDLEADTSYDRMKLALDGGAGDSLYRGHFRAED